MNEFALAREAECLKLYEMLRFQAMEVNGACALVCRLFGARARFSTSTVAQCDFILPDALHLEVLQFSLYFQYLCDYLPINEAIVKVELVSLLFFVVVGAVSCLSGATSSALRGVDRRRDRRCDAKSVA